APHFFSHAEDGIRDFHVTGVQTCALPISHIARAGKRCMLLDTVARLLTCKATLPMAAYSSRPAHPALRPRAGGAAPAAVRSGRKIGRAACRGGVEIEGGAGALRADSTTRA